MTHLVRAARSRVAYVVIVAGLIGAWTTSPARSDSVAVAQAMQNMVDVANGTLKGLENAIEGLRKQIGDPKLDEALDKSKTPAQQKQAVEDRIRSVTGVGKGQPLPDKPPEFMSDKIRQAYAIRALLDVIEAWKKLKAAWADSYKKITGKEASSVALVPTGGRNVCTTDESAYSTEAVSTTQLAGLVPKITLSGDYESGGAAPFGIATLSYDRGKWMNGSQLKFGLAPSGTGVTNQYSIGAAVNSKGFKLPLILDGRSQPIADGAAIAAVYGCAGPENVEVLRSSGGALYGRDATAGALTLLAKADCHRTATLDYGNPPTEQVFRKFELRGGYMCPSDPVRRQDALADVVSAFAEKGIRADRDSATTEYIGTTAMGYCITSFDRYSVDQNQCAGDLSQFTFSRYEIAQPREGLPAVARLRAEADVLLAQATGQRRPATSPQQVAALPNDHYFNGKNALRNGLDDQWALKRIGFESAAPDAVGSLWPRTATPVLVAVVDSGVDPTHPDLAGTLWANPKEIAGNGVDDDGNGYVDDLFGWNFVNRSNNTWDNNGHGTFVAGIIAARTNDVIGIAGVNPWARILPVKVTDFNNKGDHLYLAQGIYYAADMGARVINVSIGGKRLTLAEQYAIDYAIKKGALVVVAAGNDGIDIADFSPAAVNGTITVAATDESDKRANFSNYGAKIDISAPGVDILSLRARQSDLMALYDKDYRPGTNIVGADRLYYRLSGTSFAAPFVAGVASLIFSANPSLKPEQVKRMVLQSARDLETPGHDPLTGYGLLDARAALGADPNRYIDARITGVRLLQQDGQPVLVPSGTAAADRLARAWLEVGQGKRPASWSKASADMTKPLENASLSPIPIRHFSGPGEWTLKLVVEHADGKRRETWHELNLR